MNLTDHYNRLYAEALQRIKSDTYEIDTLLGSAQDNRFGITLLARPNETVKTSLMDFIREMESIDPGQYYYPAPDIHITVMSIISCYEGFSLASIDPSKYIKLITKALAGIKNFEIDFRGITASPSCIMVQGFPTDDTLNTIRQNLRNTFSTSELQQSIDKRYSTSTAHATVIRFTNSLIQKQKFIEALERYRDYSFGKFTVRSLELVYNDWYQRSAHVSLLHKFHPYTLAARLYFSINCKQYI